MFEILVILFLFILWILLALFVLMIIFSSFYSDFKGAPFIPNCNNVIKSSLNIAKLSHRDVLVDLGSGDGKVLFTAIKDFDIKKAIGYEVAPWPYLISLVRRRKLPQKIRKKIEVYRKSAFEADLSEATVIYLYLFPDLLEKLSGKLKSVKRKNPKIKIVSAVFKIKGMRPKKISNTFHKNFRKEVEIYLY